MKPTSPSDLVLEYVRNHEPSDALKISKALGFEKKETKRILYQLLQGGRIEMDKSAGDRPIWQPLSEKTSVHHLKDLCDEFDLGSMDYQLSNSGGRYSVTCQLKGDDRLPPTTGRAEILDKRAKVRAAHSMLLTIAGSSRVPKECSQKAGLLFLNAYNMGSQFVQFGKIERDESSYLEFKGGKDDKSSWDYVQFKEYFKAVVGKQISGIINCQYLMIENGVIPKPGEIYFGVHDNGTIQGIKVRIDSLEQVKSVESKTIDKINLLFDNVLRSLNPSPRILNINLEIDPINSKESHLNFLFIVRIILPISPYPRSCSFKSRFYMRDNASTRDATKGERDHLKFKIETKQTDTQGAYPMVHLIGGGLLLGCIILILFWFNKL
eukprot:TRINITY_DN1988_c1_g1_i4.p1 TRINITY_DN1988_c1_g1~~TRINITY_DN1988_c1_g1_i4.p1  ORF type:complete len:380 (-),score=45.77 TRINITY_DN1988_c1_g1_i4:169-1308(-)